MSFHFLQIFYQYIIVGKGDGRGSHTPPLPPPFSKIPPFWKSKMSPPFIGLSGRMFTKVVKCKPDIMPLNVFCQFYEKNLSVRE